MNYFSTLTFVALGGAIGACSRFLLSELFVLLLGRSFPYGTLFVNVTGSMMMGAFTALLTMQAVSGDPWRPLIGLGFLGALTTFSTFSMDNVNLLQQGEFVKMGLNMMLNVVLSVSACWMGYHILMKQ
ncbi:MULTISPECIES: fluoride efflux transporter CrcB [unclassified Vibrio]|uniref:Fluoride-specific ion channel FluC n=1 Tax=Vibrio sp. HB236076 TaxID=3232307 RepID=A0AB39HE07_9VIBR|nr:fluoride efflux transporter CrcB [Vibrio sp. HB161653]MDP5255830.1 fluoride efflux transporter CrcB [Vibrio sp. HB161653]